MTDAAALIRRVAQEMGLPKKRVKPEPIILVIRRGSGANAERWDRWERAWREWKGRE